MSYKLKLLLHFSKGSRLDGVSDDFFSATFDKNSPVEFLKYVGLFSEKPVIVLFQNSLRLFSGMNILSSGLYTLAVLKEIDLEPCSGHYL